MGARVILGVIAIYRHWGRLRGGDLGHMGLFLAVRNTAPAKDSGEAF